MTNFIAAMLFVVTTLVPAPPAKIVAQNAEKMSIATSTAQTIEKSFDGEVARLAKKYKQDEKTARKIIKCESSAYAHATGTLAVVGVDIGYFQINTYYHEEDALEMGLDIHKWDENLEYGFWLMEKHGLQPWSASKHCWSE